MKTYPCEIEPLEVRAAPAVLLAPANPALDVSPVTEFAESATILPALNPILAPIEQSPLSDLLVPAFGVQPLGQMGSVIPPMNAPGAFFSGLSAPGPAMWFTTLR
jgi:hypothetical protein